MSRISEKQIEALFSTPGPGRFKHFVSRVADQEHAWGLWSEGWATAGDATGVSSLALWPAREYAERCIAGAWAGYEAKELPIEDLLGSFGDTIRNQAVKISVFPTPSGRGVVVGIDQLRDALDSALAQY